MWPLTDRVVLKVGNQHKPAAKKPNTTPGIENKRRAASSHLAVHVHDHHRAGVVANHKLLWILREGNHVVDGHLRRSRQGLVRVEALPRLRVPNLKRGKTKKHVHA